MLKGVYSKYIIARAIQREVTNEARAGTTLSVVYLFGFVLTNVSFRCSSQDTKIEVIEGDGRHASGIAQLKSVIDGKDEENETLKTTVEELKVVNCLLYWGCITSYHINIQARYPIRLIK